MDAATTNSPKDLLQYTFDVWQILSVFKIRKAILSDGTVDLFLRFLCSFRMVRHHEQKRLGYDC